MPLALFRLDFHVSHILAIESDPRQAVALSRIVKDRVSGAELTVVNSKDGAVAAIRRNLPDLILVSVLFSPREEEELVAHLRTLEGADHLQTLTIPLLAGLAQFEGQSKRGLFGFRKKTAEVETQGCDPDVFAEQIVGYLKTASELKANAEAARIHAARMQAADAPPPEPQPEPHFEPQPVAQVESQPDVIAEPEPIPEPTSEPAFATVPAQPLVGYTTESLGELLSKEEAVESAPAVEYTPAAEQEPIFGSVLFAKAPKRKIKPFVEPAPVADDSSTVVEEAVRVYHTAPGIERETVVEGKPIIESAPIIEETPVVETPLVVEEAAVFTAAPVIEEAPVVETWALIEPPLPVVGAPASIEINVPSVVLASESVRAAEPAPPVRLVQRLPPLAMWARLQDAEGHKPAADPAPLDDLSEAMSVLRVPPAIATISYPAGCRIRRVVATPLSA
jgi:hypothetical protein